ncbi:4-hydroxy-3-polyprenylbenzoate decarboxylase [Dethiosulfatibacter aminovorans DSM 17477]|uniref:Flavin prenyltransferase UbiX n=1 Tax=Dethiosulfatibacter aminovorans DSM 17477 TaxID=1121476 RepID=A0A1M6C3Y2_9FIRM|nr:UbiX family flavin prenyltransferase [Dethiosulfatibacter aminovorans]SHI55474.1 4-hydroxy-3-polyprenylbenzoate decarboxylase [Dethiosulfatibacter aminovorans DSM 17477]
MKKRIVVGISGASGVIYGIRILEELKMKDYEVHLIITEAAKKNIEYETDYDVTQVEKLADVVYDNNDITAAISSGSFLTEGMIIAPCSIKSLSGISNSFNNNLLIRAADVILKEKRKLALLIRETPLHLGHIKLIENAILMGALIYPPVPSFYHKPETIEDIVNQTIGKVFDYYKIEHNLFRRWK